MFTQAQVPYFCFTSRKLILKPKGLLLTTPLPSPVQSGRGQTPLASCHSAVGFLDQRFTFQAALWAFMEIDFST